MTLKKKIFIGIKINTLAIFELCNFIKANVHKKYNSGSICSGVDNES